MKIKTRGVVLHSTKYSETSLVVKIYTENSGISSFIVSGVRTKNSRIKSNIFQPLSLVELEASGKPGQSMHRITEIQLSPPLSGIPENLIKSTIAIFLAEVLYRSIREEEHNQNLFSFISSGVQILDMSHENCSRFHVYFMIHLSKYIGFYPQGEFTENRSLFDLREGVFTDRPPVHADYLGVVLTAWLHELMKCTFENFHQVVIPKATSVSLLNALVNYYELHLTHGQIIQSHKILGEVLGL